VPSVSYAVAPLESVTSARRASALLNPLRMRLLRLAGEPASATELARRLNLPRQRVNYHVRELARAGFLRPAGRRRRRNLIEQRYVATARSYVLAPGILGPLAADWRRIEDTASADYLLALAEQLRSDVSGGEEQARSQGKHLSTLSLKSQFRLESPGQRAEFADALRRAVVDVIVRHSSPDRLETGRPARGRPFRLVLACYPAPETGAPAGTPAEPAADEGGSP
jgi:DNA-binding transcriptional ArsR family regulator